MWLSLGDIGDIGFEKADNFNEIIFGSESEASTANATASSTLINYFVYLGTTDYRGEVDYDFLDMLVEIAGNLFLSLNTVISEKYAHGLQMAMPYSRWS